MPRNLIILALLLINLSAFSNIARPTFDGASMVSGNVCVECSKPMLKEGTVSDPFSLGAPVEFDDGVGINMGKCFPLYARNKLLTWLSYYQQVGARVYVQRCVEDTSITDVAPGSKGGFVKDVFEEMLWPDGEGEAKFTTLDLPLWSEFSNPAFCNLHVAYWGTEWGDGEYVKVYAVVLDLNTKGVVKKEFVGIVKIESDSRSFFSMPRWATDGESVLFDDAEPKGDNTGQRSRLNRVSLSVK